MKLTLKSFKRDDTEFYNCYILDREANADEYFISQAKNGKTKLWVCYHWQHQIGTAKSIDGAVSICDSHLQHTTFDKMRAEMQAEIEEHESLIEWRREQGYIQKNAYGYEYRSHCDHGVELSSDESLPDCCVSNESSYPKLKSERRDESEALNTCDDPVLFRKHVERIEELDSTISNLID